jgi:hypothetical protein
MCVLVAACSEDPEVTDIEGQWRFVHYYNFETKTVSSAPADLAKSITLNFTPEGTTGTIFGHTLNSPVSGHFVIAPQGRISITTLESTPADDDISRLVQRGLSQADSYRVSSVSLNLYFHNSKEVLIFVRL